ncbi:hypothetical protein GCM10023196_051940 [Actinoallomurus vinaceus]|uniref:Uncharacterized protein n=1 Tax=Actinoallomurus vinaceus TaxID=1080074 RepID=A0ABP8UF87_9ACTN
MANGTPNRLIARTAASTAKVTMRLRTPVPLERLPITGLLPVCRRGRRSDRFDHRFCRRLAVGAGSANRGVPSVGCDGWISPEIGGRS